MASQGSEGLARDARAIQRVLTGETAAYAEIVYRHQDPLRSALSFYCFSSDEVEEHLQDAFVQAYRKLRTFDASAPFFPWLKAIAVNGLLHEIRRKDTASRHAREYLRRVQMDQLESDPDASEADGRRAALRECVKELPSRHSELLAARYREESSVAALAKRFRTTAGAIKVRLLRLRNALKDCIERRLSTAGGSSW